MKKRNPTDLKSCPFCGEAPREERYEPHRHYIVNLPSYPGAWSIECDRCEFRIFDHESRENAVAKWNRRTLPREPTDSQIKAAIDVAKAYQELYDHDWLIDAIPRYYTAMIDVIDDAPKGS